MTVKDWIKQPTTIHGIAALVTSVVGATAQVLTHEASISAPVALAVGGLVALLLPDSTAEVKPVEQFVTDTVNAAVAGAVRQRLPILLSDASAILAPLITQPAPAAPVAPAPTPPAQ